MNLHAERPGEGGGEFPIERRARAHERLEAARPEPVARVSREVRVHERDAMEHARAEPDGVGEDRLRHEGLAQDDGRALHEQRDDQVAQAVRVRQGNRRDLTIVRADVHGFRDVERVLEELGFARERGLGESGRAGCDLQRCRPPVDVGRGRGAGDLNRDQLIGERGGGTEIEAGAAEGGDRDRGPETSGQRGDYG